MTRSCSSNKRSFHMVAGLALVVAGCSERSGPPDDVGGFQAALNISPGRELDSIHYDLAGTHMFHREGDVPLGSSTSAMFTIGGVPPGADYMLTISGTATDGSACSGTSAPFAIVAGMTSRISVHIDCREPARKGSVTADATINTCPVVDGVSASPAEVAVGGSVSLTAAVHDSDGGPAPLTYAWTAQSGVFSDPAANAPTFKCTEGGTFRIKLTAGDGGCTTSDEMVTITCTAPCPEPDGDACSVDVCQDGMTTHVQTPWSGCQAAVAQSLTCSPTLEETQVPQLEACGSALGDALASASEDEDADAAWNEFAACRDRVMACGQADETMMLQSALSTSGGGVCNRTAYLACIKGAADAFLVDSTKCGLALVRLRPADFSLCMAQATAAFMLRKQLCIAANSCRAGQVCVAERCVDPTIQVDSATYGANCGVGAGNATSALGGACDNQSSCDFFVHNNVLGDPAYGCAKSFDATYHCTGSSGTKNASHGPVAGEGYTVSLSCP